MLGFGLTTYSLGLISPKEDPKFPFYHSKFKKTEIFVGKILEPGTLFLRASQRVSVTQGGYPEAVSPQRLQGGRQLLIGIQAT